jgi:hypothetical protein
MRAMGQMNHSHKEEGVMLMKTKVRGELIHRSWKTLPAGWKWRND